MKQVIALSVALAAAMVGSYLTWTDDSEPVATDGAEVYRARDGELKSVTWSSDERTIAISSRSDELGDYLWIESKETREVPKPVEPEPDDAPDESPADEDDVPDELPDEPPEMEMVEETIEVSFAGNDAAEKLWSDFQPLVALRELPDAASLDAEVFGLDEPTGTVTVTLEDQQVELTIGGETYGSKDRYARVGDSVFLLDDGDLRPLQFAATRLVERTLFPLIDSEVEQVVVTQGDAPPMVFEHRNRDDRQAAHFTWASQPDEADDQVDAWVGRLLKLRLRRYLTAEEAGALSPLFRYEVRGEGQAYPVEILEGPDGTVYARSAHNRSLVELTASLADGLDAELGELTPPAE